MADYLHQRIVLRKRLDTTNNWESESNGIVLEDVMVPKATENIGKKRDTFSFKIRSPNNILYEQFFSGDNITKAFTLHNYPIPTEHLSGEYKKFNVYISDVLKKYTTDYTVSGSTITFGSAPTSGNKNIRIIYPTVEADDLVDIYFWKNMTWSGMTDQQKNDSRVIEGTIIEPNIIKVGNYVGVRGYGLIDSIFSGMAFAKFNPEVVDTSDKAIQQIISQLNKFNPNRRIYGQDSIEWSAIGNATPTYSEPYTSKYRSAIEMIEELSGDKYTGNGQHIYYLIYDSPNNRYEFHWKAKPINVTGTITEGTEPSIIKIQKAVDEVVNVVIYNCGLDPYGKGMEYLHHDVNVTGYGARWKYLSETSTIGSDLVEAEFQADTTLWEKTTDEHRYENFPKDTSYTYTFQFAIRSKAGYPARGTTTSTSANKLVDSTASFDSYINGKTIKNITDGTSATISAVDNETTLSLDTDIFTADEKYIVYQTAANDNDFSNKIRTEAQFSGKARADKYIKLYSNPRFKSTLFVPYSQASPSTYILGDVYKLDFPSFGLDEKLLRLTEINYEFTGIQLNFEEDEKTILES